MTRAAYNARRRGYTLVELLAVIAMVGILAALALVGYRRYVNAAKTSDAKAIISAIRTAQESHRSETLAYLDVSSSMTDWYPTTPNGKLQGWPNPAHADDGRWRILNAVTDSATTFGFACRAGAAGDAVFAPNIAATPTFDVPGEPWYIIQAAGDADGDGTLALFVSSSRGAEMFIENESE